MHRSPALSPRDAEACALVVKAGIDGVERLEGVLGRSSAGARRPRAVVAERHDR